MKFFHARRKPGCIVSWEGFDEGVCSASELECLVRRVAKEEEITVAVIRTDSPEVKGPLARKQTKQDTYLTVFVPMEGTLNRSFHMTSGLSTLARMRATVIAGWNGPPEKKLFICLLMDILHEMGHVKYHYDQVGDRTHDTERYWQDLEYRLQIEDEAERLTTKWLKRFGYYDIVNDLTKLE